MNQIFVDQLESVVKAYDEILRKSKYDDGSDLLKKGLDSELILRSLTAIERAVGRNCTYYERADKATGGRSTGASTLKVLIGIARAVLADIRDGYLTTFAELIHGEVFSDYLDMAEHLLASHYKDAAAVIAGSSLEAHLKQLAKKNSVDLQKPNSEPKKASSINDELKAKSVYGPNDHKSITSWLGLRNDAAHGDYSEYTEEQVRVLVAGIREFIARKPA